MNASRIAAVLAQELRVARRDGEQLLLTLGIPLAFLVFFATVDVIDYDDPAGELVPGMLGLALFGSGFVRPAIALGFDRAFGAVSRLALTPLRVSEFLAARALGAAVIGAVQVVLVGAVGLALGWEPTITAALPLVLVAGLWTFTTLALVVASVTDGLRTLALANLVFIAALLLSGAVAPLDRLPDTLAGVARVLPPSAMIAGLRSATSGATVDGWVWWNLAAWGLLAPAAALRFFRWADD